MIRRLRDYYRQFEELSQEEISRELRERRDAERARALTEVPPLDLASASWHEPPDAEAVNAATYALRRRLNAYPDDTPLRKALAERHLLEPVQVACGHGAGEILHAAFRAVAPVGEVAIAWPGWGPLPRLVHEAGAAPVPVPLGGDGAPDLAALAEAAGRDTRAVVLCTPNDPTGAALAAGDLVALARELHESVWLVVDAALAEFGPDEPSARDDRASGGDESSAGDDRAPGGDESSARDDRAPGGDEPSARDDRAPGGDEPSAGDERGATGGEPSAATLARLVAARERVLVVRSFSKAHALAGLRVGFAAAGDEELLDRLAPAGGVSAPAQAAALWAVREGDRVVARRRAAAARERERLAAALEGTPLSFPRGHGHLVWLSSAEHDGAGLARHLAARRIYVTPGAAWGDDRHVRVTLRDAAATDRLTAALAEL